MSFAFHKKMVVLVLVDLLILSRHDPISLVVRQGDKMGCLAGFSFKFSTIFKERICSELMSPPCKLFRVYLSVCVCVCVVIVCV